MAKVSVNASVLHWAIDRASLTPNMLESKFPKLQQWLIGESLPTFRQLESLAKTTHTPFGYFFLDTPPQEELPLPYFRTHEDEGEDNFSPELLDTIHSMQRRQNWMREYLIDLGHGPLDYVGSVNLNQDPLFIAQQIRSTLELPEEWASQLPTWELALRNLRETIESAGILVVGNGIVDNNTHRKLDPREFRGFVLVDEFAPLVFVNNADVKAAQMFTLAHELAHIFLGSSAAFDLRNMTPADDSIEMLCNKVAAEFLVPAAKLREYRQQAIQNPEPYNDIARRFKVSELVGARRALDLNLIAKDEFFAFYNDYLVDERRKATKQGDGGGNFYNNQDMQVGRRFAFAVARAAREGKLSYKEAYRLTGLYGWTFEKYITSRGMLI